MSTRSGNQQKKQRQKEFKEKKEHLESLKAAAKKDTYKNDNKVDRIPKIED